MKNLSTLVLCFLSANFLLAFKNVEEVVVIGTKASLISAIDKQRESNKILSVVDSDALGEFLTLPQLKQFDDYLVFQLKMIKVKDVMFLLEDLVQI